MTNTVRNRLVLNLFLIMLITFGIIFTVSYTSFSKNIKKDEYVATEASASFVQIDVREIVDLLAFEDEGRTYFGLYSKNGENISGTELGPYVATRNLFDSIKGVIDEKTWNEVMKNETRMKDSWEFMK